jgi:CheY-like chemotaxis protein
MAEQPKPDVRSIEILLVEDDPGDTLLITEALEHHKVRNRLTCVTDGARALDYLHGRMDGRELLAIIKRDEGLRTIPVVVLTTLRGRRPAQLPDAGQRLRRQAGRLRSLHGDRPPDR